MPLINAQTRTPDSGCAAVSTETRNLLVFQLSGQVYALPLEAVNEILPMAELLSPPCRPSMLAGFLDLGGALLPVVRLEHLFGLSKCATSLYTPLLVVRNGYGHLALIAERVLGIQEVPASSITPIDQGYTVNGCTEGLVRLQPGHAILLSVERLLLDEEGKRLAELANAEQSRRSELAESAS